MLNSDCDRIPDPCFAPGPLLPSKTGLLLVSGSAAAGLPVNGLFDGLRVSALDLPYERHQPIANLDQVVLVAGEVCRQESLLVEDAGDQDKQHAEG